MSATNIDAIPGKIPQSLATVQQTRVPSVWPQLLLASLCQGGGRKEWTETRATSSGLASTISCTLRTALNYFFQSCFNLTWPCFIKAGPKLWSWIEEMLMFGKWGDSGYKSRFELFYWFFFKKKNTTTIQLLTIFCMLIILFGILTP